MNREIKRVVFLTLSPLSSRDYERFGIDILESSGLKVEVIYLGYLVYRIENNIEFSDMAYEITDYTQLKESFLKFKRDSIFVKLFGLSSKTIKIDIFLSKYNVLSVGVNQNIIPLTIKEISYFEKIRFHLKTLSINGLLQKLIFLYSIKILRIKASNYMILGGLKSNNIKDDSITKIWTHSLDYNLFLEQKKTNKIVTNDKYVLYLDEYLPYHPDYKKIGIDREYKDIADIYYQKMNSFFDNIEKNYNLKVIIAVHPRAEYKKIGDVWSGREIIFGKSIELVKDSLFCMMHASTSINFSVLYQKPILFLTFKELEPLYGSFISSFSKEIGCSKIFIDNEFNKNQIDKSLIVKEKEYKRYRENYIKKSGTPEKNSWQIFADFIKKENGEMKNVQQ